MQGKDLLTSKTFWGAAIGLIAVVLAQFGISFDQAHVTNDIVALIGFGIAVYGRITAEQPITSTAGIRRKKGAS